MLDTVLFGMDSTLGIKRGGTILAGMVTGKAFKVPQERMVVDQEGAKLKVGIAFLSGLWKRRTSGVYRYPSLRRVEKQSDVIGQCIEES